MNTENGSLITTRTQSPGAKRQGDVREWRQGKKDWRDVITKPVRSGSKSWLGFNMAVPKGVERGPSVR